MENSRYILKNCKALRTGYTTGSCAAAASKAAAWMLKHQKPLKKVTIDTPKGWQLHLDVCDPNFTVEEASCYVVKDSGDDPDITNGIHVWSKVCYSKDDAIMIQGGKGIGRVTKKGLQVPVGSSAINPTPLKMIEKEVREVVAKEGLLIEISMPEGIELAKKTFNPRLGIEGGLSVLGTSGIVEPMSEEALKDTIALELTMARQKGEANIIMVPGSIGQKLLIEACGLKNVYIVKISNYLGFALEKCAELGFKKVILAGHIGKLIKPAGGIYYTHSRVSTTRLEILTAYLGLLGMDQKGLEAIMACTTTEEALNIVSNYKMEEVYTLLADKAASHCEGYIYDNMAVGIILFSMKKRLAQSQKVEEIMEDIIHAAN